MSFDNASTEVMGEHGGIINDGTFGDKKKAFLHDPEWAIYFHKQVLVIEHIGFWLLLSACMVSSFTTESNCLVFIENE